MRKLALVLVVAACGDDANTTPDAGTMIDGKTVDTPPMIDGAPSFTPPTPYKVPLSAGGPDQIHSVKAGPGGSFFLAGFVAQTATGDKAIFVAKTTATGPDTTFGNVPNSGVAVLPQVFTPGGGSGTDEIDLAVQSSGKVLVSFTVADPDDATDRDVRVARLTTAGALDTTFAGGAGFITIDFSAKGSGTVLDTARGLTVDSNDNIFVHALAKSPTGTDSDFAVAKITPDGTLATGWGLNDTGKFFLDTPIGSTPSAATPRGIVALADGSIIAGGYSNAIGPGNQPVIYKLDANGDLATSFNGTGYFFDTVLTRQTEAYNFALQNGTHVITGGYGNEANITRDDWISLRVDVATGQRDMTWGGSTNGAKVIDVSPNMTSSNCRNAVPLPGGKTLLIGSTGPGNMAAQDGVFVILDANGNVDTKYNGINRFKLDSADGNDQFWGAAESGGNILIAGWRGTSGAAQSATLNDDSYLIVFPVQ